MTQLGCLHDHQPAQPLPEKLESFLAQGSPPVYIGFGSMTDADPNTTTRIAIDAIERSGCRAILAGKSHRSPRPGPPPKQF